ncbi:MULTISPECIES: hypothetical protein [Thioalkalivibrio]|uniref:Uncharacterized protein n=1 Tax=Thioalkalivibrio versutus TaxID=106634 RepID=A0A0G3G1R8_9GAMM|nr:MULTISPECIES: hypothetical protein [Thioalkalivibrio]AKJ95115.1 hypothetical protein TVD_06965 [Thioalkalivibrio versutus]OOC50959.1 hypothetical protein B0684_01435 [Thioalkalivibrio versutus]
MTEPNVQRGTLLFWMAISLGVALLIVALGVGLEPAGAPILRAPLSSPAAGALGFGLLMVWAAYAYALSAGRAAGSQEMGVVILNLGLPVALILLWRAELNALAFFVALGWALTLGGMAVRLFRREALAGVMMLPLIGVSLTAILLSLTLWVLPAATGGA